MEQNNNLFTIYGARVSKAGDRVVISLCKGGKDGEARTWGSVTVKLGESTAKTLASIKDGYAYVKIPLLKDKEEIKTDELDF